VYKVKIKVGDDTKARKRKIKTGKRRRMLVEVICGAEQVADGRSDRQDGMCAQE
jgi:hypothetical protein